jgi:DNA-binding transcriptional MerR regulator
LANTIAFLESTAKGSSTELNNLRSTLEPYKKDLRDAAKAGAAATVAQRNQTAAVQQAVDAYDAQNATFEGLQKRVADYEKSLRSLSGAYDAAQAGAKGFTDSIEKSTGLDDIASATVDLSGKLRTLNTDLAALPKNFNDAFDPTKISEASGKAIDSIISIGEAANKQFSALIASGNEELVPALAAKYRDTLTKALQAAGLPPAEIQKYLGLAGLTDQQITVALKVANVEEELAKVKQRLALFQTDLSNAPQSIRVAIDKALLSNNIDLANRLIDAYINKKRNPIVVDVLTQIANNGSGVPYNIPTLEKAQNKDLNGNGVIGRATGGPVAKNKRYMVNEFAPELFVPDKPGFILDANKSAQLISAVQELVDTTSKPAPVQPPMRAAMEMPTALQSTPKPIEPQPINLPVLVAKAAPAPEAPKAPPRIEMPKAAPDAPKPTVVAPIVVNAPAPTPVERNAVEPKVAERKPEPIVVNAPAPKADRKAERKAEPFVIKAPKPEMPAFEPVVVERQVPQTAMLAPMRPEPAKPVTVNVAAPRVEAPQVPTAVEPRPFAPAPPAPAPAQTVDQSSTTTLAPVTNTFNITTTDPQLTALEVVRRQRDAAFLMGR